MYQLLQWIHDYYPTVGVHVPVIVKMSTELQSAALLNHLRQFDSVAVISLHASVMDLVCGAHSAVTNNIMKL